MIKIIKTRVIEIIEQAKNRATSIGLNMNGKKHVHIPGMSCSYPIDVFNQKGKRLKSGIFVIDWGVDSSTKDD